MDNSLIGPTGGRSRGILQWKRTRITFVLHSAQLAGLGLSNTAAAALTNILLTLSSLVGGVVVSDVDMINEVNQH